jgi:hypothetical protein
MSGYDAVERRPTEVTVFLPERRLAVRIIVAPFVVAVLAAACGSSTPTGSSASPASPTSLPSPSAATTPSPPATTAPPASESPSPSPRLPTQTSVEWGRIWDALPPGFPRPVGAVPSEIGVAASGVFDLSEDVPTAAGVMKGALEAAGFRTEGVSGPLEDGSVVIDSIGERPGCRVRTTVARQGGVTMMTVLYGASCPFE